MTKNDAIVNGRESGKAAAASVSEDVLRQEVSVMRALAVEWAFRAASVLTGLRRDAETAFSSAFIEAFMVEQQSRWNALPDVKAALDAERFERSLESMERSARGAVAKFTTNLAENAAYAFEWADAAAAGAAELKVCATVRAWMSHETKPATLDVVRQELARQVRSGARFPKHRTSALTNLMAQNELAAQASLLSDLDGILGR